MRLQTVAPRRNDARTGHSPQSKNRLDRVIPCLEAVHDRVEDPCVLDALCVGLDHPVAPAVPQGLLGGVESWYHLGGKELSDGHLEGIGYPNEANVAWNRLPGLVAGKRTLVQARRPAEVSPDRMTAPEAYRPHPLPQLRLGDYSVIDPAHVLAHRPLPVRVASPAWPSRRVSTVGEIVCNKTLQESNDGDTLALSVPMMEITI